MNFKEFVSSGKLAESVKVLENGLESLNTSMALGGITLLEAYTKGAEVVAQAFKGFELIPLKTYDIASFNYEGVSSNPVNYIMGLSDALGHSIYFKICIGSSFNIEYGGYIHVNKCIKIPDSVNAMVRGRDIEGDTITWRQEVKATSYESFVAGIMCAIYNLNSTTKNYEC